MRFVFWLCVIGDQLAPKVTVLNWTRRPHNEQIKSEKAKKRSMNRRGFTLTEWHEVDTNQQLRVGRPAGYSNRSLQSCC